MTNRNGSTTTTNTITTITTTTTNNNNSNNNSNNNIFCSVLTVVGSTFRLTLWNLTDIREYFHRSKTDFANSSAFGLFFHFHPNSRMLQASNIT